MAVRTGAGTGVVVSLVVFVLATVFLLVLTIVFYAGKNDALKLQSDAQQKLEKYVTAQQQSSELYKGFEQASGASRQSVAGLLNARHEALMQYVSGNPSTTLEALQTQLNGYGIPENEAVVSAIEMMKRSERNAKVEIEGLNRTLEERRAEVAERDAQIAQMKRDHDAAVEAIHQELNGYREAAEEYRQRVEDTVNEFQQAVTRMQNQYEAEINGLEDELDTGRQQVVLLRQRVDDLEGILRRQRDLRTKPELLVDAQVIDVDTANDLVYINRGREDRMVLGLTFEVYDGGSQVQVDAQSGEVFPGKASLQVTKVNDKTSVGKITRTVPGRPVVRNDSLVNSIYDPTYRFKFLVHGKFDVDRDGRPSEAEAQHIRSRVVEWGGEVIEGDDLPGDLDFLVLGVKPPMPAPLRPDATPTQIQIWTQQRADVQKYEDLFRQASEAQIPVLNSNRFFILIGDAAR